MSDPSPADTGPDVAGVAAVERCKDMHPRRWESSPDPDAMPPLGYPCHACASWGIHVRRMLAPLIAAESES